MPTDGYMGSFTEKILNIYKFATSSLACPLMPVDVYLIHVKDRIGNTLSPTSGQMVNDIHILQDCLPVLKVQWSSVASQEQSKQQQ